MDLNHYFTNQELNQLLPAWAAQYPDLLEVSTLGQSYQKRPIWLLTLTNKATGPDREKPAVWLDANIHATELAGTTTTLHIAESLLTGYGKDPQITRLLDHSVYYIVPRLNPDGAELALAANPRYVRSGVRPYPWEEKAEGLHEMDIDGDGRVLQMRLRDPNGDWKISTLDPRLMEKRQPHDQGGEYYRLLPEGLLEDFDGYLVKVAPPLEGLDFNRNFPAGWRPEGEQHGSGPYPASEPEIRAVLDFISHHPNISLAITYHTYSRVILRPSSMRPDDELDTSDLWVFKKIGEIGSQITGYRCVSVFHDFKYHPKEITTGAFDDWMYDHWGAFAYTIELWDIATEAGIKDRKLIEWFREHPHTDDVQILQWALENAGPDAYVDWYEFDHPQLGRVELGGWNRMFTWRNPPPPLMGAEAGRNAPFALALGDMLPRLSLHTLELTPLGSGDYRLNLVVENAGFLPTYTSQQGKKCGQIRPVRAELELSEGVTLVNGKRRMELGHLEGRSNKLEVTSLWSDSSMDNRARTEWVLHGPAGATIKVHVLSERAGALHRAIQLP